MSRPPGIVPLSRLAVERVTEALLCTLQSEEMVAIIESTSPVAVTEHFVNSRSHLQLTNKQFVKVFQGLFQ